MFGSLSLHLGSTDPQGTPATHPPPSPPALGPQPRPAPQPCPPQFTTPLLFSSPSLVLVCVHASRPSSQVGLWALTPPHFSHSAFGATLSTWQPTPCPPPHQLPLFAADPSSLPLQAPPVLGFEPPCARQSWATSAVEEQVSAGWPQTMEMGTIIQNNTGLERLRNIRIHVKLVRAAQISQKKIIFPSCTWPQLSKLPGEEVVQCPGPRSWPDVS